MYFQSCVFSLLSFVFCLGCKSSLPQSNVKIIPGPKAISTQIGAGRVPVTALLVFKPRFGDQTTSTCTMSKVQPSLYITAAHCVYDAKKNELFFQKGNTIWISMIRNLDAAYVSNIDLGVKKNYLTPVEVTEVYTPFYFYEDYINKLSRDPITETFAPDLAFIRVDTNLTNLEEATLDLDYEVSDKEVVAFAGYGCKSASEYIFGKKSYDAWISTTKIISPGKVWLKTGRKIGGRKAKRYYFYSPSHLKDETSASGCPGDSGGPAFKVKDMKSGDKINTIIGITSQILTEKLKKDPEHPEKITHVDFFWISFSRLKAKPDNKKFLRPSLEGLVKKSTFYSAVRIAKEESFNNKRFTEEDALIVKWPDSL